MTRVNIGIKPQQLIDQHLLAEHREIKRIPKLFKDRIAKNHSFNDIPNTFTLNAGHMKFFLDKPRLTYTRYHLLWLECLKRDFNVTNFKDSWDVYSTGKEYSPTTSDTEIIKERLKSKILSMKSEPRYYGKVISRQEAISLLK